jgi:hypothetical protein
LLSPNGCENDFTENLPSSIAHRYLSGGHLGFGLASGAWVQKIATQPFNSTERKGSPWLSKKEKSALTRIVLVSLPMDRNIAARSVKQARKLRTSIASAAIRVARAASLSCDPGI